MKTENQLTCPIDRGEEEDTFLSNFSEYFTYIRRGIVYT